MRNPLVCRFAVILLLVTLAMPSLAHAQPNDRNDRDRLWNGMVIGAGIGAAVGMLIAPPAFCGGHDTECAAIVRATIGLGSIAAGVGVGALIDGLQSRDASVPFADGRATKPRAAELQMTVRF